MREITASLSFPMEVSNKELTIRTYSLAMDIGTYMSQVMLANLPTLRWEHWMKNKRFIDYGQPVLMGFNADVPFNPVHICVVLASGLARKSRSGSRLRELYDIWKQQVAAL